MSNEKEKKLRSDVDPSWRYIIAITIASLETTLLPFLIIIIVLIALIFAFRF
jgi:hypothetical protein